MFIPELLQKSERAEVDPSKGKERWISKVVYLYLPTFSHFMNKQIYFSSLVRNTALERKQNERLWKCHL